MSKKDRRGKKLYPFQKKDVKRFRKEPTGGGLCASVTGAGKTLVGVAAFDHKNLRQVLVVAPVNTFDGWESTLREQTGQALRRIGNYDEKARIALIALRTGRPGWYFVGWEWFANQAAIPDFRHVDGVIFDEIHRASTKHTRTQRAAYQLGNLVEKNGGVRLGLSATPFGNKLEGAWGVERALWPSRTPRSFYDWALPRLKTAKMDISGHHDTEPKIVHKVVGEREPGLIVSQMPLYWRHEALTRCCDDHPNGVQADLPSRIVRQVGVPITAAQRRMYRELERLWRALPEDSQIAIETEGYAMVLDLRMHQVLLATPTTEQVQIWKKDPLGQRTKEDWTQVKYPPNTRSTKLDAMMDILADIPKGERVLIFTHSRAILDAIEYRIEKKFGKGYIGLWHGGVSKKAREALKKDFMKPDGSIRIIAAQTRSISEGVDGLQRVCWNEIWLSQLTDDKNNIQARGRLWRRGQTRPVQSWQIHAVDTVEEGQYKRLEAAQEMMNAALSGKS